MSNRRIWIAVAGLMMLGLVGACATTTLSTTWVDPTAKDKKLGTVMVIGVARDAGVRRRYEDLFVSELARKKITAIASYRFLPDPAAINKESVLPVVTEHQVTQVLVTRLVDIQTVQSYVPPTTTYVGSPYPNYYGSWYGYYGSSYTMVTSPGYSYETSYATLESNIYEVASEKLIWSGRTETEMGGNIDSKLTEFVVVLMGGMAKSGLL